MHYNGQQEIPSLGVNCLSNKELEVFQKLYKWTNIGMSGIKVSEVRVRNFRSLQEVDVSLDDLTVLIGENNSGKTSLLEALHLAIGAGRRIVSADDVFVSLADKNVPKDRTITIDLLIRPVNEHGKVIETFPEGGYWLLLWGNGVSQDEKENDFVGIRTEVKWDETRGEYVLERRFLADWPADPKKWHEAKVKEKAASVLARHIEPIALYYMDAKRDIYDEMQNRGSFWHRMISDPGLTDAEIERLEQQLTKLNEEIISASDVLRHIQANLDELYQTLDSPKGSVAITPTARTLRNLGKGMDVYFATREAQAFPLARHGMGTRSLAALLTFRAYMTWREKKWRESREESDSFHPMLALEEPEAHLHPQAQRALFRQIQDIPGQRIVSTHSPYIASGAKISQFRYFRRSGPRTVVTQMDMTALSAEDERKLDRMVMNTRGDLLYARAAILCSGETEEQALPIFAEEYFHRHPSELGITIFGVGGDGSYRPFARLPHSFKIPWYIFSDGEVAALGRVQAAVQELGEAFPSPRLFFLPDQKNYEQFLASKNEYRDILISVIIESTAKNARHRKVLEQDWAKKQDVEEAITKELSKENNKTKYAKPVAQAIVQKAPANLKIPSPMKDLFEAVAKELRIRPE